MTMTDTKVTTKGRRRITSSMRSADSVRRSLGDRPRSSRTGGSPLDLLEDLISTGCFGLFRPASHGGIGADLPSGLQVIESLARADASVGWTVLIGSLSWCDLTGLSRAAFDDLFPAGQQTIVAGVFNPTGTISASEGTYRVTGRWSFASGCEHADWIFGNCVAGIIDGVPKFRIAVFSPDQVVIEDTWNVVGLSGTGSHHFRVEDVEVPAERTCVPMSEEPCLDVPIVRLPIPAMISLGIASVAVGVAQGAIDDIIALAGEKVPLLAHEPLAAGPVFQLELARARTPSCAPAGRCWSKPPSRCGRRPSRNLPSRSSTEPRLAPPRSGRPSEPWRSSRRPIATEAEPRCTPTDRYSAAYATSTP